MAGNFENKTAVVTGASSGIGKAIAFALLEQGAFVYMIGRNKERLEEAASAKPGFAHAAAIDFTDNESIAFLIKTIESKTKSVDILVHSAGIYRSSEVNNATANDFDELYKSNVRAPFLLTQALLPMIKHCSGQVVFINSTQGLNAGRNTSQFASTQHSLKAIADSLRDEVNSDGIRVLSLFLGRTATPRMESFYEKQGKTYDPSVLMQPEDVASVVCHTLSLPRTVEVTNINMRPMIKSY